MLNIKIKILTSLILALAVKAPLCAAIFKEEAFKTHLRWKFEVQKSDLMVKKSGNKISFQTLDLKLFEKVKKELSGYKLPQAYFKNLTSSLIGFPEKPATVEIELANSEVEFFTFYKNNENRIIIDFWKNKLIDEDKTISSIEKNQKKQISQKNKKAVTAKNKKVLKSISNLNGKEQRSTISKQMFKFEPYRDFRYGLSLIWDYDPIIPEIETKINLKSKTAEYFYPIEDRKFQDDEKEAHMQLTINLYRKKKLFEHR